MNLAGIGVTLGEIDENRGAIDANPVDTGANQGAIGANPVETGTNRGAIHADRDEIDASPADIDVSPV
jgi:hypothetical protein